MKYLIFIISFWLLATSLMPFAHAATTQPPAPSILPGQTLYFLELIKEKIQILTAINPAAKAQLYLDLANQRLAEYKALAEQGKGDLAKKSFNQYLENIKLSLQTLKQQNKSAGPPNDAASQLQNQTQDLSATSQAINQTLPDKLSRAQQIAQQARDLIHGFIFTKPISAPTATSSKTTWLQWLQKMFEKLWPSNLQLIKKQ